MAQQIVLIAAVVFCLESQVLGVLGADGEDGMETTTLFGELKMKVIIGRMRLLEVLSRLELLIISCDLWPIRLMFRRKWFRLKLKIIYDVKNIFRDLWFHFLIGNFKVSFHFRAFEKAVLWWAFCSADTKIIVFYDVFITWLLWSNLFIYLFVIVWEYVKNILCKWHRKHSKYFMLDRIVS